ncbi:putative ABC heavy metal transporter [Aspergillus clavatus NRRL 1]|uniref:ABC heavy metal transporter, putative n=1 Tax=Aspergillus clavatus (strain ATCC 1007 / CBS 513.65 / DSM 816 / NCTC 3887 / NRRL 1 / QM 1276 / 107) TaxID=344612 RepID=A1CGG0_ASPCL|nr:ABC heavy metal transporter, putative [Aspergillus clavatus NRRL 1]EAW11040.1 ABC heavy metal transporter, putative [Aspergillus clavatus NRRL 1]
MSIAATGYLISRSVPSEAWWTTKEYLASTIAVWMFLAAGLLPDPDEPFAPSLSHCHAWLATLTVEVLQLVMFCVEASHQTGTTSFERVQVGLVTLRVCFQIAMAALYLQPMYAWSRVKLDETEPLLRQTSLETRDAQHGGWLDYVTGFSTLFPFLWPSDSRQLQLRAIFCFFLLLIQRAVNILVPHQLGLVVAALGSKTIPLRQVAVYICLRALQGQQGVIGSIRALLWIPVSQSTYRRLTSSAFEHVLSLSLDFHLGKRIGEVMSALSKGSALNTFLDGLVFQLFPMVADLWIAAVYFLVKFDAFYSLIVIAVTWMYLFVTIYMAKYRGRARREMVNREREMEAAKTDALLSYETVHHNSAVPHELGRFSRLVQSFQQAEYFVFFSLNLLNAMQNLLFTAGVAIVCLLCAYQISADMQKVAMFVTLLAYLSQLQAPLNFFGSFYTQVQNNLVDAERMLALFETKSLIKDRDDAINLDYCRGRVEFNEVDFAYDERRPALRKVSFVVEPGTSTAIVGESGSGKSTILKLLFRFYDVAGGSVRVDGVDVRDMTAASLRGHLGVVPQDTILFNDTLLYNLRYARPSATMDELYAACRAASIHDRIMSFPDGYETNVGERGLRLSGGEKQRIAIARTFLRSPQILLLDEATASLDSQTERQIQASLENVAKGRTTITIAHRLSTITKADQIIVLHQGHIVEKGTHAQLLAAGGLYGQMWEKQTKAKEKEDKDAEENRDLVEFP